MALGLLVVGWLVVELAFADPAGERRPRMARPRLGTQIVVGPITVPSGGEVTECTYLKLPKKRDLAVNRVKMKVGGGSHHIHLYRPADRTMNVPDGHETCDFALDFEVWQLILANQSTRLHWRLPRGVAFHFRGGEQLLAQTHFVDNGLLSTPDDGWALMNLHAIPKRRVKAWAGAIFGQDRDVVVAPRSRSTATTRCLFPKPVRLLALTGHYHYRGVQFTASTWDGVGGTEIYRQDGYEDPLFARYGDNLGELRGLEWTCAYENPTDETFTFGPFTDDNEHCNVFAFYYPALDERESMTCVQESGVTRVTVHD
jgi:hypothetical protein